MSTAPDVSAGVLAARVFPRLYRDSVALMALASALEKNDGVLRVGVVMGTPANIEILARSDMQPPDLAAAPDDLVVSVRAVDAEAVEAALAAAAEGLTSVDAGPSAAGAPAPGTVREALELEPGITVATVSTPGAYAPVVVEQALRRGLHVFCFSDNVSIADEVRLKRLAVDRGLLLMGPDCGTAILDGVPLGFANVVRRGPVSLVSASGTGAQEVSCLLDRAGTGVAQIVGVGGRDLGHEVGGLMTHHALGLVAGDPDTEVVVVVSKPPAPDVAARLLERLRSLGKPAVACLLGMADADGDVLVRGTLEGGAAAAAQLVGAGGPGTDDGPDDPARRPEGRLVRGLFAGGTLAAEAKHVLHAAGVDAEVIDLGDDQYTAGRPHPMIDPTLRAEEVAASGLRADVGVVLVDLVLGHGASADPATPLAEAAVAAMAAARAEGRTLHVVGSVCGTQSDPQGLSRQEAVLRDAGVLLAPSAAAAARRAARLVGADLARPTHGSEAGR